MTGGVTGTGAALERHRLSGQQPAPPPGSPAERELVARLIPARANGQPAFGFYARDPDTGRYHTVGLLVLTLSGPRISAMTRFDPAVLPRFGLPSSLGSSPGRGKAQPGGHLVIPAQ